MPHEKFNPPDGSAAGAGEWTGKKRRRHPGPSHLRCSGEISISSSSSGAQGDQEEPIVIAPSDPPDDLENDIISDEDIVSYIELLSSRAVRLAIVFSMKQLKGARREEVCQRHALYRIRAHKLSNGESRDKLDDATLRKEYPPARLEMEDYFKHYEQDGTLDWYFDPCYSKLADLGDYQRLVLKENGVEYLSWEDYRSSFTSYEVDRDYVKYHEEISKKIQWIKRYVKCDQTSLEWMKMCCRGAHQAFRIAAGYRHMTLGLARTAYQEHIWNLTFDYQFCEDMDRLIFEIWKRVAKQKMTFRNALEEVHREKLVPQRIDYTEYALEDNSWSDLKPNFEKCVEDIPDDAAEDEAKESIIRAVWKRPKQKMRYQYLMKKMEIVQNIGLDPQA